MTNRFAFSQLRSTARGTRVPALCVILLVVALGLSADEDKRIITFDAPAAGTGAGQGTLPQGISDTGAIAGFYLDASNVYHGFLRTRHGTFITFEAPGADTTADSFNGTLPFSINSAGAIAGEYLDASSVLHGFLRARDGTFITFDVPGAGTGAGQGTFAFNINPEGVIAGAYIDASNVFHGFLRAPGGAITTFDAPGAGTGLFQGTSTGSVDCINPEGAIVGTYRDASNVLHGFLRAPGGAITTIDPPGAGTGTFQGTVPAGINEAGRIEGEYTDASNVAHGFLRTRDGAITTFDVPGAGNGVGAPGCFLTLTCQGTYPENINQEGAITGQYVDASGVNHGFLRAPGGAITTFDAPGAGTASGQGTIPFGNNAADAITGPYIDASGANHGFLRTGRRCREDGENCRGDDR